jgi:CheY-like chemotaxis protein
LRRKTSITGAIEDPILRFAAELARAVQFHRLYPPEHPYVKTAAETAYAACEVAFNKQNPFTFGATDAGFFIEQEVVPVPPSVVEELAKALKELNIHSLTVRRGVSETEIKDFVVKLGELENAALQGTLEESRLGELKDTCPHIDINMFSYEKVLATEGDLLKKVKDVAAETGEDEMDLLDMMLGGRGGEVGGVGGRKLSDAAVSMPGDVASLLVKGLDEAIADSGEDLGVLAKAGGILESDDPADASAVGKLKERLLGFFDRIGSAMAIHKNAGLGQVREALGSIVSLMPPSSQKMLFGKEFGGGETVELKALFSSLPIESRVSLLFNELSAGEGSAEQMQDELKTILKHGAELAKIADMVSEKAQRLGSHESVSKIISRLSSALQSGIRPEALVRGTVVLVDPDPDSTMGYRTTLAKEGWRVMAFSDGAKALEHMKRSLPDLLVTEIKMHGVSGIEIIRELRKMSPEGKPGGSTSPVPVIITTAYPSFAKDFDIATYPKSAFFEKPVDADVFMDKARELLPREVPDERPIEVEGKVLVDTEEIETAREVQESLLPGSLPEIEGFDVAVDYTPCRDVGGDYYDVLPQGEDSQTFIVADVSGKGVPAAMVMVMVRSLVHLSLPSCDNPRDAIVELNKMLSSEIKQGLFVSAVYARIDPKARRVTLCSAGHCPAVTWIPGRDKPEVTLLKHTGVVMGLGDTSYFREGTREQVLQLEPGAGVMIYTDGIIETMNQRRREFGTERLMRLVSNSSNMGAADMNRALREAVNAFSSGAPQHDDITILTIKCTK